MEARIPVLAVVAGVLAAGTADAQCERAKLVPADGLPGDEAGRAVALILNQCALGAPRDDNGRGTDAGSVYVFGFRSGMWTQDARLSGPDGQSQDRFGASVALDTGRLAVVAELDDTGRGIDSGSAWIFRAEGFAWRPEALLVGDEFRPGDTVTGIALDGDLCAVVSPGADTERGDATGAVTVFRYSPQTRLWLQEARLSVPSGEPGDRLGRVALDGTVIVAGAPLAHAGAGAAYVWELQGSQWVFTSTLRPSNGGPGDAFGSSVAVSGGRIVVGSPGFGDGLDFQRGRTLVFERLRTTWGETDVLMDPDGVRDDQMGSSVAIEGRTVVVGSARALDGIGAALIFRLGDGGWYHDATFAAGDAVPGDLFASTGVAIHAGQVLAGVPFDDDLGLNSGSATVFDAERCCAADFNGDGLLDSDDFFDFLDTLVAGDQRADFNRDGTLDADDLFDFLNAYNAGC